MAVKGARTAGVLMNKVIVQRELVDRHWKCSNVAQRGCVRVWAAIEGPREKMPHLLGGVDISVGRDQPVDYRCVPVLSRDVKRGDPDLRSE